MNVLKKICIALLALVVLIYVGYQGYMRINDPYTTEIVFRYSVSDSLSVEGIILRDEYLLKSADGLAVGYLFDDGERVAKNATVAKLYNSKSDIADRDIIEKLEADVELLEQSAKASSDYYTNAEAITKQIISKLISYSNVCENQFVENISASKNSFLLSPNKRLSTLDKNADYKTALSEAKALLSEYKQKQGASVSSIRTPQAGYFVSRVDGYEGVLTTDGYTDRSLDEYLDLISNKVTAGPGEVVGKIITEPHWYLAIDVPTAAADNFYIGRVLDVDFPFSTIETIEATVVERIIQKENDRMIVFLQSSAMSENLAVTRTCTVQIKFRTITGLRLNSKAIRHNENHEQGVYIISGEQIKFKKINIIYEGNGFCLTEYNDSDSEYLQFYDEVVIEGKELYDSKLT